MSPFSKGDKLVVTSPITAKTTKPRGQVSLRCGREVRCDGNGSYSFHMLKTTSLLPPTVAAKVVRFSYPDDLALRDMETII